jgi:ribosome-associated protein
MTKTDPAALAQSMSLAALEKLASDVRIIDLRGVVSYTDYFVVCTGQNPRLTKAISDHVIDEMVEQGHRRPKRRESDPDGSWLLLDWGDVVLHIFTPEARAFYRLESLWGQVPQQPVHDELAATRTADDKAAAQG